MSDDDMIRRGDALEAAWDFDGIEAYNAIAALPAVTAPQGVDAPYLSKTGDLIGHPLEQKLRNEWRKVAKHHGVPHNGVLEADLVRAFLVALAPAQPALDDRLAKAVEALRTIVDSYEATSELHTSSEDLAANLYDHARAVLAEIEGESDA